MANARMNNAVAGVEAIIGYTFNDKFLLWEALQAAGSNVSIAGTRTITDGNKRLAVVGDKILELVLAERWYGSGQVRGTWDEVRRRVGCNQNLYAVGVQTGLNAFVNLAGGATVISPKTMTATVEAILAGVWLDGGLQALRPVMQILGLA
ncbi:MAG: hypothetical protein Q9209_004582 [Squamulea sp. 1 TL-2023]